MTAEELPDASVFSFDVPEGTKNIIYRYDGFKALGIDAHDEKERKESGIPNNPAASWVQRVYWVRLCLMTDRTALDGNFDTKLPSAFLRNQQLESCSYRLIIANIAQFLQSDGNHIANCSQLPIPAHLFDPLSDYSKPGQNPAYTAKCTLPVNDYRKKMTSTKGKKAGICSEKTVSAIKASCWRLFSTGGNLV